MAESSTTSWRERMQSWPSVRLRIELAPWHWRLHTYSDDLSWTWSVDVGPLQVEVWTDIARPAQNGRSSPRDDER